MRIEKNLRKRGSGQENVPTRVITSIEEWEVFAGPKLKKQWKEKRSACELAKAWLSTGSPAIPIDLCRLFATCTLTQCMTVEVVHPEERIWFDEFSGEPRNTDLAFIGESAGKKVAVNIEAKADESFGNTLKGALAAAKKAFDANNKSKRRERISQLTEAIFGTSGGTSPEELLLRYQLLTAVAGAVAYASEHKADIAVLVVHVFEPEGKKTKASERNDRDWAEFLAQLSRSCNTPLKGEGLEGPFLLPGGGRLEKGMPLLIGKVVTRLAKN